MDEILTYEQLKDYLVKMCDEAKEDFADSSKKLTTLFKSLQSKRKRTISLRREITWCD